MAKAIEKEQAPKGAYICSECKQEFEGQACPECGNAKGNLKLAPDGIEQSWHKGSHLFSAETLKPVDKITFPDIKVLEAKRIQMQMEELDDNLRESQVIKTRMKLKEQEMAFKRKEIEAKQLEDMSKDFVQGRTMTMQQQSESQSNIKEPNLPFMQQLSPQAVFMQQLMRMDSKKREEFIQQLSDADPGALANLSAMFTPAQSMFTPPQNQQQWSQNTYIPPWAYPQQQTHQPPQQDPIAMITAIFELQQKMAPPKDDSLKEILLEIKEEIKRNKEVSQQKPAIPQELIPILEKINRMEQKLSDPQPQKKSIADSISEISTLVTGLTELGLVAKPNTVDKSVDDQLKLKEFDFKKETAEKQIELEREKIEAEKNKSSLQQNIVTSLIQRGIQKTMTARQEESQQATTQRVKRVETNRQTRKPDEVISEVVTDSGVIRETRRPVDKELEVQ